MKSSFQNMERTCADGTVVVSMTRNLVAWPARDGRLPAVEGHHRTATGSRAVLANENWADGGLCLTRRVVEANKDFWSFETSIIMPSIHDLGREDPLQYWTTSDLGAVTLPIHCSFFFLRFNIWNVPINFLGLNSYSLSWNVGHWQV